MRIASSTRAAARIEGTQDQNEGGPEWLIGVPCAGVCVCGGAGESSLGADGRAWFVVVSLLSAGLVPCFSKYVSGDGAYTDVFS